MGTEILRPQDYLIERLRVVPSVMPRRNSNARSNRKPIIRPQQKKRVAQSEPLVSKKSTVDQSRSSKNNIVMGRVTILKRGEYLDFKIKDETLMKKSVSCNGESDPEIVLKQIQIKDEKSIRSDDVYAGSAFFMSPSPRSLPLPTFSKKKEGLAIVDDSATKDLRRLLRLD